MDIKTIENIKTAEEITKIIDETFSPNYMYYDVWGVIKGEWKEEIAIKDEVYSLLFQIQEINRQLHGDNITPSEHVPNLHERNDLMTKRRDLAVKVKNMLEGKNQQNDDNKQPQQAIRDLLPDRLKVNKAICIFQRGFDCGLLITYQNGLKWQDTKQLLAYFAQELSKKFKLSTKLDANCNETTNWVIFENLFRVKNLKGAKQNWMRTNTKFEPTGFEKVKNLL